MIEGAPEGVLAFEAVGEVDTEHCNEVLKPAIEASFEGDDDLRIVYEIGPDFDRYPAGVAWEDIAMGFAHLTRWKRRAVVTDLGWVEHAAKAFGWISARANADPVAEIRLATSRLAIVPVRTDPVTIDLSRRP